MVRLSIPLPFQPLNQKVPLRSTACEMWKERAQGKHSRPQEGKPVDDLRRRHLQVTFRSSFFAPFALFPSFPCPLSSLFPFRHLVRWTTSPSRPQMDQAPLVSLLLVKLLLPSLLFVNPKTRSRPIGSSSHVTKVSPLPIITNPIASSKFNLTSSYRAMRRRS